MALSPGARLGIYKVAGTLGAGGMGVVYKARDTRLDRDVALKVLPLAFTRDRDRLARFEKEAKVLASLNHPGIAAIHGIEESEGTRALVLELVEGGTLADRLASASSTSRAFSIDQVVDIARQIADALDAAHERGVIHRDLKPSNVGLTRDGMVKVLDFGIAKTAATEVSPPGAAGGERLTGPTLSVTQAGIVLGTAAYMSPEQARGQSVDKRTDIWAFGCLLFEMLSGKRPFARTTASDPVTVILEREPDWTALPPDVPPNLRRLLERCLQKDVRRRLRDIGDVQEYLIPAAESGAPATARTHRRKVVLTALASALVSGLGVWLVQPHRTAPSPRPEEATIFTIDPPSGLSLAGAAASTSVPQFAVSPDGRRVTFLAADAQGRSNLWLRALDDPQSRLLPGTEGAIDPFWSPDSRSIGFVSRGELKSTEINTQGSPRIIARAQVDSRGAAWNRDGTIVFYTTRPAALSRVSSAGGSVTDLSFSGVPGMIRWPEFLPDGEHLLFQVRHADPTRAGIYIASLGGTTPSVQRLTGSDWTGRYGSGFLLFLNGSTLLAQPFDAKRLEISGSPVPIARDVGGSSTAYSAFSVSATGVLAYTGGLANQSELRWVDRSGRVGTLVSPKGDYTDVSLSPDQSRVAISRVDPLTQAPDVWILDLTRGTSARITTERLIDASPIWSPTGDQIVFRSNRSSTIGLELYRTSSSPGGTIERILGLEDFGSDIPTNIFPSHWSRDGTIVYFQSTLKAGYGIWTATIGKHDPMPVLDTSFNEVQPAISPDGQWMAYASDESGHYEIYLQHFPDGKQRQLVSTSGGQQPQWRGDGRELYYIQADGSMMAVGVKSNEQLEPPTALFKTTIPTAINPYRMDYVPAADGQRFLMKVPVMETPPALTVVVNWPALLKKTETDK